MIPAITATTNYAANPMSIRAVLVTLVNRIAQDENAERADWTRVEILHGEIETDGPHPLRTLTMIVPLLEVEQ